jgi:hypothetical protein
MELSPEQQKMLRSTNDALSAAMDAAMPRPEGKEDWSYRDLPKVREDFFAELLALIGEENIHWLTRAQYVHDGEVFKRGQMFVSPAGLERLRVHIASKRAATPNDREAGDPDAEPGPGLNQKDSI